MSPAPPSPKTIQQRFGLRPPPQKWARPSSFEFCTLRIECDRRGSFHSRPTGHTSLTTETLSTACLALHQVLKNPRLIHLPATFHSVTSLTLTEIAVNHKHMNRTLLSCLFSFAATLHATQAADAKSFALKDGDRVVFYGDSITDQRLYTTFTETFAVTRFPKLKYRFRSFGLGRRSSHRRWWW